MGESRGTITWEQFIENESKKEYYIKLQEKISSIKQPIYPPEKEIFSAFQLCSYDNTKVIILGQDPYHGPNQAHGLSFSVKKGNKIPPSLRNILKELKNDVNIDRQSSDLTEWAKQGVLLLNNVLTVTEHKPNSHKNFGWEIFTDNVINELNKNKKGLVFILWGNNAQIKAKNIDQTKHFIIQSCHPSPLSANRGDFFGSKPFSKCNNLLNNKIDW